MLDINFLEKSAFFEEKTLKKGELLFDEQEIDNNFYIIKDGILSIEKYTTKQRKNTKILAELKVGDFLGEASFTSTQPKQVLVKALENTKLIFIQSKNLEKFLAKYPVQTKDFLLTIIETLNMRVNIGNKYITSIYEINKSINSIEKINYLEIFKLLEKIKLIMGIDFIIFLEKNSVIKDYFIYKYNSNFPLKMQNKTIDIKNYDLFNDFEIEKNCNILEKNITIGSEVLAKIIIGKKQIFSGNDKRLFFGIINSIAGIIKQKEIFDELRDKNFMKQDY